MLFPHLFFLPLECDVCDREKKKTKTPLTFHIQAILFPLQTMVERLFLSAPKRSAPRPYPNAFTHVCIAGGHAEAVRVNAGIDSISTGGYRYSSPLWGFFFLSWSCCDRYRRRAAIGQQRRRGPPPLCHVRAAGFLLTLYYNMAAWSKLEHNYYFLYKCPTV